MHSVLRLVKFELQYPESKFLGMSFFFNIHLCTYCFVLDFIRYHFSFQSTIHVSQYASCLQLENVYSVCDQNIVTIEPTNVLQGHSTMYKREFSPMGRMNFELEDTSLMQEEEYHPLGHSPNDEQ